MQSDSKIVLEPNGIRILNIAVNTINKKIANNYYYDKLYLITNTEIITFDVLFEYCSVDL